MNNMLLFCESDVALRCPEVEMAIFSGLFDLFTGTYESADSEGDDVLDRTFDSDCDASDSAALGRFQLNVGRTSKGVSCIYM